jgi:hypothetical protein
MAIQDHLATLVTSPAVLLFSVLIVTPTLLLINDVLRWWRLPPGPTPLPFIGNKFDIPKSQPWLQFEEWSKKYGSIFTLWIGRKPTLMFEQLYFRAKHNG